MLWTEYTTFGAHHCLVCLVTRAANVNSPTPEYEGWYRVGPVIRAVSDSSRPATKRQVSSCAFSNFCIYSGPVIFVPLLRQPLPPTKRKKCSETNHR